MRIRKTNQNERGVYKYITTEQTKTGKYVKKTIVIKPGENGVTELDIKRLHSFDDNEVRNNNKNSRPERTTEEKEAIKKWKRGYIQKFKEKHGYEPHKDYVDYVANEAFPRNYNLSMDSGEVDFDKSELGFMSASYDNDDFDWSDNMKKAMTEMTDKQKQVIKLMSVDALKQNEVAKRLGISPAAVHKHFNKAKKIIEKYF